jgi:hypothetical protein
LTCAWSPLRRLPPRPPSGRPLSLALRVLGARYHAARGVAPYGIETCRVVSAADRAAQDESAHERCRVGLKGCVAWDISREWALQLIERIVVFGFGARFGAGTGMATGLIVLQHAIAKRGVTMARETRRTSIHHAACSVQRSMRTMQCTTGDMRHTPYSNRRRTCDTHRTACNRGTPPGWQGGLRRLRTCAASLTFAASSSAVARVFRQPWCGVVCKYDSARVLSAAKRNRPLHPFA